MNLKERIQAFSKLGSYFSNGLDDDLIQKLKEAEFKEYQEQLQLDSD